MRTIKARIFSKAHCPYCVKAKALLDEQGIPFDESIVGEDVTKQDIQTMVDGMGLNTRITTVPQIFFISGNSEMSEYIGGYTELAKYIKENR